MNDGAGGAGPARQHPATSERPALRRRFLIIRNRHAGTASRNLIDAVIGELQRSGASAELVETETASELTRALVDASSADAVVAAGGDGTLRAVARAMRAMRLEQPLGLIPAGTGNVMAAELAIPRDKTGLAAMLMQSPVRQVAMGRANGEPFFCMCGAGFDGAVVARLSLPLKERIGRAAYVPAVLSELSHEPQMFEVTIDGRRIFASWVIATNARHYGGRFVIVSGAGVLGNELTAVVLTASTRIGRVVELLAIATGTVARCPSIEIMPLTRLTIAARGVPAIQIDGDAGGAAPLLVEAANATMDLIVPQ